MQPSDFDKVILPAPDLREYLRLAKRLGFSPEQSALMMAIYLALDGYGPACNVSGDGAITLIIDRFFGKRYASAQ